MKHHALAPRLIAGSLAGTMLFTAFPASAQQESERIAAAFDGAQRTDSRQFDADEVKIEHINAVIRVMPGDRDDISVELFGGPAPEFSVRGGLLTVDGGIDNDDWRTDWCKLRERTSERTVMVVHVPMAFDISMQGAIDASVAAAEDGSIDGYGCGHVNVAAMSGDVSAKAANSISMSISSIGGDAALDSMNSSTLTVGPVTGELAARAMNSSRMTLDTVGGETAMEVFNSANAKVSLIGGDTTLRVYNSADLTIDTVRGDVTARLMNSASLEATTITGNLEVRQQNGADGRFGTIGGALEASLSNGSDLRIASLSNAPQARLDLGNGSDVSIEGGLIADLDLTLDGDSAIDFNGKVENGTISMRSDEDSYIAEAVTIAMHKHRHADGEVRFGKLGTLTE